MPLYCYICTECGMKFEKYGRYGEHDVSCPGCGCIVIDRDYKTEFSSIGVIADDWPAGYNIGISYHYSSKEDLLREIRARGWEPSRYDNGLKPVKRPLYEKEKWAPKRPKEPDDVIIED